VVPVPTCAASTGKRIAIVGGGPCGLTAAYFLQLMGHQAVVYEKHEQLGGMLRYGIPNYRLSRERLHDDIDAIVSSGVEVRLNRKIGTDVTFEDLRWEYDAVYLAIGAHNDKKLGIDGENAHNVISAVEMLGAIGDEKKPDFTGKSVVVVGGGNVAMDCVRTAVRLGAKSSSIVYRRRTTDMTALPQEIEEAKSEGCEIMQLMAPDHIEQDENGAVTALFAQRQIIGKFVDGRASVTSTKEPPVRIPADVVIVAVGQAIDTKPFTASGLPVSHGTFQADLAGQLAGKGGIFAGGDSVTGPATVIKAVAAGKVAAANIDEYLGYHHTIRVEMDIPEPPARINTSCARVNIREELACERKNNFNMVETSMTPAEMQQECSRCFRCDRHGFGALKGGTSEQW
ncbi:MAG: FAD-dependent oxidoreductase, partial [Oscillospiraceae bacterium]|nr:FAD-dependent oxidoreductase [Oscillospiraceae bacterium]